MVIYLFFFFFKQKTAYEMCGRDWSSDVCSSDLLWSELMWYNLALVVRKSGLPVSLPHSVQDLRHCGIMNTGFLKHSPLAAHSSHLAGSLLYLLVQRSDGKIYCMSMSLRRIHWWKWLPIFLTWWRGQIRTEFTWLLTVGCHPLSICFTFSSLRPHITVFVILNILTMWSLCLLTIALWGMLIYLWETYV